MYSILTKSFIFLSYDPRILERMLVEQHYGTEYLKKIVQMEIFNCLPYDSGVYSGCEMLNAFKFNNEHTVFLLRRMWKNILQHS